MRHTVTVGAKWAQIGHGIDLALDTASQRIEVMNFDVRTSVGRAVERIEVVAARNARIAVCAYSGGAIAWITFVGAALSKNFAAFRVTASALDSMRCIFRFNVRSRLGLDFGS